MNVLLLGKFPPCQGGIAAKTYWLVRALAECGISYDIVTLVPEVYRSAATGPLPDGVHLRALTSETSPWFLPGTDLAVERIVSAALALAKERTPDIVEANYLAPFGIAAFIVSRLLKTPLLLRHAGSDLAKLLPWEPVHTALGAVIAVADRVVTADDQSPASYSQRLPPGAKTTCLPRYVPDETAFRPTAAARGGPVLLLAGKLNYYWRLKALDTLFEALESMPSWRLLCLGAGVGSDAVSKEADRRGLASHIEWRPFVAPSEMPAIIAGATAVWAVQRVGPVTDFSNIAWESVAMGRPCIVSPSTWAHPDAALLRQSPGLLTVDPEEPGDVISTLEGALAIDDTGSLQGLAMTYRAYLDAQADLYREVATGNDSQRPGAVS